jgi:hypothetical protein
VHRFESKKTAHGRDSKKRTGKTVRRIENRLSLLKEDSPDISLLPVG